MPRTSRTVAGMGAGAEAVGVDVQTGGQGGRRNRRRPDAITAEEREKLRVFGEYTLIKELGGGGMGRVFKAFHRKMDRIVAIKLLPPSLIQSGESVERFQREVQTLARLAHPNIVAVHDAGTANGTHYYVMDLIEGRDLGRMVKEDGPLSIERAVDYVLQAARGWSMPTRKGSSTATSSRPT